MITFLRTGSAFQNNFAFEPLLEDLDVPLSVIIEAMTIQPVAQGDIIVEQGMSVSSFCFILFSNWEPYLRRHWRLLLHC